MRGSFFRVEGSGSRWYLLRVQGIRFRCSACQLFGCPGTGVILEIKDTHRPYGGPVLLGIALPQGPVAVRVLNFE